MSSTNSRSTLEYPRRSAVDLRRPLEPRLSSSIQEAQEEFYSRGSRAPTSYDKMDLCLWAYDHRGLRSMIWARSCVLARSR